MSVDKRRKEDRSECDVSRQIRVHCSVSNFASVLNLHLEVYHRAPGKRRTNWMQQRRTVVPTAGEIDGFERISKFVSLGIIKRAVDPTKQEPVRQKRGSLGRNRSDEAILH